MKRIGYLALLAIAAVAFPESGHARVFKAYGIENFVRSTKAPYAEVREFTAQNPEVSQSTLHLFYAGIIKDFQGIAPSAVVTFNSQAIVTPDEFNRNVYYIKKPVTPAEKRRRQKEDIIQSVTTH